MFSLFVAVASFYSPSPSPSRFPHPTHILELWKFQGQILYFSTVTFFLSSLRARLSCCCCCCYSLYRFCLALIFLNSNFVLDIFFFTFSKVILTRENSKQRRELFKHLASLSCLLLWLFVYNLALHSLFACVNDSASRMNDRLLVV